jgi:CheY-like chemotaxis protein
MSIRLHLVQWNQTAAEARARELRAAGYEVAVEFEDPARATRHILNNPPDLVLFDLDFRGAQSRETAAALRRFKAMRRLPMLFIDGDAVDIDKTRSRVRQSLFASSELLLHYLGKFEP